MTDVRSFFVRGKGPKFYGVQSGHTPGVYKTWEEAQEQIRGFAGARHKSFGSQEEAEDFVIQGSQNPLRHSDLQGSQNPLRHSDLQGSQKLPEIYQPPDSLSQLNPQQRAAFDAVMAGKSIFLTGPGGTGKSFLLHNLYAHFKGYTGKKAAITAMTGCAALLIGPFAKTLHSWAGIGLGRGEPDKIAEAVSSDKRKGARWRQAGCLIIDEVSMMTPALLELLDIVGRKARKCPNKPFGGIQIVFVGDFYQLPPVSRDGLSFAFESPLWSQIVQETHFLTEIVRQKDPVFQKILNEARTGDLTPESYAILESRKTMEWKRQEIKPTLLFTKNNDVSAINDNQLRKLTGEEHVFKAETKSSPKMPADIVQMLSDKLDKDAPYEAELHLKERAQVMLLTNQDPASGLVNGSRGVITGFGIDGLPLVKFLNGPAFSVKIEKATWSSGDEEDAVHREQIPLRVAYALTIHKAQGASLDSALVDVGPSTFECGQAYVALSRVRNLDAVFIFEISPKAFRAHPAVKAFYRELKN